jgi:hypothetical protein
MIDAYPLGPPAVLPDGMTAALDLIPNTRAQRVDGGTSDAN